LLGLEISSPTTTMFHRHHPLPSCAVRCGCTLLDDVKVYIESRFTVAPTTASPTSAPTAAPTIKSCDANLDVCFIIDGSGSVAASSWRQALAFVDDVVSGMKITDQVNNHSHGAQVAVMTFSGSSSVATYFNSDASKTLGSLKTLILNLRQPCVLPPTRA
jgi:hypothetical protein